MAGAGRVAESHLVFGEGRTLHVYDTAPGDRARLAVVWHHGTPNVGAPPAPLFDAAARLGVRWVSYDRPGYGGSTRVPARDVGSAADDVGAVADALGLERFALMGHSGGAPHALACAARLESRVAGVVSVASLAPIDAEGLDWYAGMAASGQASLRAAAAGRSAKEAYEASGADYDPEFTPADQAALAGRWSWLLQVVEAANAGGPDGLVDDDITYVSPWGFDPRSITSPLLFVHGGRDRVVPPSHSEWLARRVSRSELWRSPEDGHISVLDHGPAALEWLVERVGHG